MASATNLSRKDRAIPSIMAGSASVQTEIKKLRDDINILAQHLAGVKQDMQQKINSLTDSANDDNKANRQMVGMVVDDLESKSSDEFGLIARTIVDADNKESREKLLDEVSSIIQNAPHHSSGGGIGTMVHYIFTAVLSVAVVLLMIKVF